MHPGLIAAAHSQPSRRTAYATAPARKEEILQEYQHQIKAYGVRRLGLFGSFVRQHQVSDSDIDLLVEFEPGRKTFDNFLHVALLLEEVLGRRGELVTPEALSPYIGPHIL